MRATPSSTISGYARPLRVLLSAAGLLGLVSASEALARPEAPAILCEAYPDSATCRGRSASCDVCHTSTSPAAWNDYGNSLIAEIDRDNFESSLSTAFETIASLDADKDGVPNEDELLMGTPPGDASEGLCEPTSASADDATAGTSAAAQSYDLERANAKVHALFCGTRPTFEQRRSFAELADDEARSAALHAQLDECLASAFWRDVALPRLADPKIKPVKVLGRESSAGVVLGDYYWDYRLFTYVLTGGRDARDLLLATYHVNVAEDGSLVRVEGVLPGDIDPPPSQGSTGGQPLQPEYRAGMLTTQWFLAYNTLLSALPRITAAQAYRAYLDLDIAKLEGIKPVSTEPLDIDNRGVGAPDCATCHTTLDPLSYAFTFYEGVGGPGVGPGMYNPTRPKRVIEGWASPPGSLFDEPVDSVLDWANVAADSEAFQRMLGAMFFSYLFDRDPTPSELPAFDQCWLGLPASNFSADELLHCLVAMPAFSTRSSE